MLPSDMETTRIPPPRRRGRAGPPLYALAALLSLADLSTARAADPCEAFLSLGVPCSSQELTLYSREGENGEVFRSSPIPLPAGRDSFACCATAGADAPLFLAHAADSRRPPEAGQDPEACRIAILGSPDALRDMAARKEDAPEFSVMTPAPEAGALFEIRGLTDPAARERLAGGICGFDGDEPLWFEPLPSAASADAESFEGWTKVGSVRLLAIPAAEEE